MKTLNFELTVRHPLPRLLCCLLLLSAGPLNAQAQAEAQEEETTEEIPAVKIRPDASDATSEKLIRNYLTVTGGADAYNKLMNVVATGTLEEAGKTKRFELIEMQDGKRHLTLSWRHLGRNYKELKVFDGLIAWRQEISPQLEEAEDYSGQESIHFSNQRWLLQPFVLPSVADYIFKYQGTAQVGGRVCYLVVGFGKKDERSWFYFDKATFLLLRWGGFGEIAGVKEYMDYRASKFKRVGGVMLPREIELLAENAVFGSVQFESILTNKEVDLGRFSKPTSRIPVLRQRPANGG